MRRQRWSADVSVLGVRGDGERTRGVAVQAARQHRRLVCHHAHGASVESRKPWAQEWQQP